MVLVEIEKKREKWGIITIYNRKNWEETGESINKMIEEKDMELERIIVSGDFNIRIGELWGMEEEVGGKGRKSKDKMVSNQSRKLINWIYSKG